MHLKPRLSIRLVFLASDEFNIVKSPQAEAMQDIMIDVLIEAVSKEVGADACYADISYSAANYNEIDGFKLKFEGYSGD